MYNLAFGDHLMDDDTTSSGLRDSSYTAGLVRQAHAIPFVLENDERCQEVAAKPDRPRQQTWQSTEAIVQSPKQPRDDKDMLVSSQENVVGKTIGA